MRVEIYDKQKGWLQGTLVEGVVKIGNDQEGYNVYGDNVRHPTYPSRCPVCGQQDDWKVWEMLMGLLLVLTCAAVIATGVAQVVKLFQ